MEPSNGALQLSDMPAAFLRSVAVALWGDGKDLARLTATCKTLRSLCDDSAIWKVLLLRRFGPSVVPGMRPSAEDFRHVNFEGWVFYQAKDGSQDEDPHHAEADLQQLLALAESAGAEAFTTSGKIVSVLHKPQNAWKHLSYNPRQGMYVKRSAVECRQLKQPEAAAGGAAWPPEVPGWVYFPSCVSEGYSDDVVPQCSSLPELLTTSEKSRNIVAVTTQGELKHKLRPQQCWKTDPAYHVGLYVKSDLVSKLQLTLPPTEPDYRALYAKLDSLRLDASKMSVVWLDGRYLDLLPDVYNLTGSGMLVDLNAVWWLDLRGSMKGVPPGTYEVCWVVNVTDAYWQPDCEINMSAQAQPHAAPRNEATAMFTGSSVAVKYGILQIQQLQQQCHEQNSSWGVISGGVIQVPDFSTVAMRFWSTDDTHKCKMQWAYVELKPCDQPQQPVRALAGVGCRRGQPAEHRQQYPGYMAAHGHQQQYGFAPELGPLGGVAQWLLGLMGGIFGAGQAHQAIDNDDIEEDVEEYDDDYEEDGSITSGGDDDVDEED